MGSSLAQMILGNTAEYQRYEELVSSFGSDEMLIIGLESPSVSTEQDVARLERIADRIDTMEQVSRVESVLDIADRLTPAGGLDLEVLARDPIAGGLLVSRDGRSLAFLVEVAPQQRMALEETPAVVESIVDVFRDEGIDDALLHLGGLTATLATIADETRLNVRRLLPFMALLLLGTVYVLFRRLWPAFVALAVGTLAVIWTMGFAILLDRQLDVLIALCPALILLITFSDVVHLCSAYMLELGAGRTKRDAIIDSATEVGVACLFTSLTTFAGFLGLSLVNVPAFRRFGLVAGFGVAAALLLAMTLVPIILSYMKAPKPWRTDRLRWLDRFLGLMRAQATDRPWLVIGAFAVVLALAVIGSLRIEVETNLTTRFAESSRYRQDADWFDEHFAGTGVLEVFVRWPDPALVGPDLPLELARYTDALADLPGISRTLSVVDVARTMVDLDDPQAAALETSALEDLTAQMLALERPRLRRLVDHDERRIRIVAFLTETGVSATHELGEQAKTLAREHLGNLIEVDASGLIYLAGVWLEDNVRSQKTAIIVSFIVISAIMMFLFASVRIGLWSMVPNVIPLLVLGGILGFAFHHTDSDLAVVALIAIGIAVDDTIHFLCRARIESRRATEPREAIERTFASAGRAIAMTSIIFAVGFLPFATSSYLTIRLLGLLLPVTMLVALAADLLLLPALMQVRALRV